MITKWYNQAGNIVQTELLQRQITTTTFAQKLKVTSKDLIKYFIDQTTIIDRLAKCEPPVVYSEGDRILKYFSGMHKLYREKLETIQDLQPELTCRQLHEKLLKKKKSKSVKMTKVYIKTSWETSVMKE